MYLIFYISTVATTFLLHSAYPSVFSIFFCFLSIPLEPITILLYINILFTLLLPLLLLMQPLSIICVQNGFSYSLSGFYTTATLKPQLFLYCFYNFTSSIIPLP
jgi:hypothetical protein